MQLEFRFCSHVDENKELFTLYVDRVMRDGFRAKEKKGTSRFTDVPHVEVNKAVQYVYPDVDDGGSEGLMNKDVSFLGCFVAN